MHRIMLMPKMRIQHLLCLDRCSSDLPAGGSLVRYTLHRVMPIVHLSQFVFRSHVACDAPAGGSPARCAGKRMEQNWNWNASSDLDAQDASGAARFFPANVR
eukprot:6790292-Pyramimonas_sp.AAC.1